MRRFSPAIVGLLLGTLGVFVACDRERIPRGPVVPPSVEAADDSSDRLLQGIVRDLTGMGPELATEDGVGGAGAAGTEAELLEGAAAGDAPDPEGAAVQSHVMDTTVHHEPMGAPPGVR